MMHAQLQANVPATGWRNARVLAVCQALFISAMSINLTLTGLVGYTLADDKAYATVPA